MFHINAKEMIDTYGIVQVQEPLWHSRHHSLSEFLKLVLEKIPMSYAIHSSNSNRVYIALHGFPVVIGHIYLCYGRKSNNLGKMLYGVMSSKINNLRGSANEKESLNIKDAVRNAAKYLTKPSYHECIRENATYLAGSRRKRVASFITDYTTAQRELFSSCSNSVINFVLDSYHNKNIADSWLNEKVEKLLLFKGIWDEKVAEQPDFFDAVIPIYNKDLEQTHVAVLGVYSSEKPANMNTWFEPNKETSAKIISINELPEHITNAIPMISMVEEGEYIEGFGCRKGTELYFIERWND